MGKTERLANEIIRLFIEEQIPLSIQIDALKLAKEKIEFCKKSGAEMRQNKLKV